MAEEMAKLLHFIKMHIREVTQAFYLYLFRNHFLLLIFFLHFIELFASYRIIQLARYICSVY